MDKLPVMVVLLGFSVLPISQAVRLVFVDPLSLLVDLLCAYRVLPGNSRIVMGKPPASIVLQASFYQILAQPHAIVAQSDELHLLPEQPFVLSA